MGVRTCVKKNLKIKDTKERLKENKVKRRELEIKN